MKRFGKNSILAACLLATALMGTAEAKPAADKKPAAKPCVEKIHIIYGCHTCEAMLGWLKKGGVEIEIKETQTGPYKLYPTVIYSDKAVDHGETMYKHQATIPEKICVIRCNVGTE